MERNPGRGPEQQSDSEEISLKHDEIRDTISVVCVALMVPTIIYLVVLVVMARCSTN